MVAFPPAVGVVVIGVGASGLAVEAVAGGEPVGTGFVSEKRDLIAAADQLHGVRLEIVCIILCRDVVAVGWQDTILDAVRIGIVVRPVAAV